MLRQALVPRQIHFDGCHGCVSRSLRAIEHTADTAVARLIRPFRFDGTLERKKPTKLVGFCVFRFVFDFRRA